MVNLFSVVCRLDGGMMRGCLRVCRGFVVRRGLLRSLGGNGMGFSSGDFGSGRGGGRSTLTWL